MSVLKRSKPACLWSGKRGPNLKQTIVRGGLADQQRTRAVYVLPEYEDILHKRLAYTDRFMPIFIILFIISIGGLIASTLVDDSYLEEASLVILGINFIIFPFSNVHILRFAEPSALPLRTVETIGRILGALVLIMAAVTILA